MQEKKDTLGKAWHLFDGDGKILGRLASKVATVLRGKDKPVFSPHLDTGDFVVVINAQKIRMTGKKLEDKVFYRHSGYPGGLKAITAKALLQKKPEELIRTAVKGMLPKNRLGRKLLKKLKVYPGAEHPHQAQQPKGMEL